MAADIEAGAVARVIPVVESTDLVGFPCLVVIRQPSGLEPLDGLTEIKLQKEALDKEITGRLENGIGDIRNFLIIHRRLAHQQRLQHALRGVSANGIHGDITNEPTVARTDNGIVVQLHVVDSMRIGAGYGSRGRNALPKRYVQLLHDLPRLLGQQEIGPLAAGNALAGYMIIPHQQAIGRVVRQERDKNARRQGQRAFVIPLEIVHLNAVHRGDIADEQFTACLVYGQFVNTQVLPAAVPLVQETGFEPAFPVQQDHPVFLRLGHNQIVRHIIQPLLHGAQQRFIRRLQLQVADVGKVLQAEVLLGVTLGEVHGHGSGRRLGNHRLYGGSRLVGRPGVFLGMGTTCQQEDGQCGTEQEIHKGKGISQ